MHKIKNCFLSYENMFKSVNTENKRFNILRKYGYIDFEEYIVDSTLESNNDKSLTSKHIYAIHVPLKESLKAFLELPGIFEEIIQYIDELNKNKYLITNIIQADLWVREYSKKVLDGILLPIYLYYDEFEAGNCLGSYKGKNKFGATYIVIGCLPPNIASLVSSIIFAGLIRHEDMHKKLLMKRCLEK